MSAKPEIIKPGKTRKVTQSGSSRKNIVKAATSTLFIKKQSK